MGAADRCWSSRRVGRQLEASCDQSCSNVCSIAHSTVFSRNQKCTSISLVLTTSQLEVWGPRSQSLGSLVGAEFCTARDELQSMRTRLSPAQAHAKTTPFRPLLLSRRAVGRVLLIAMLINTDCVRCSSAASAFLFYHFCTLHNGSNTRVLR